MMFYDKNVAKMCVSIKERMRDVSMWFPYPALIGFFLVTIFVGHLIPSLNPRFGSPAQLVSHKADREPEGAIWFSVYTSDDQLIHVKTIDKMHFSWPTANPTAEDIRPFTEYLKTRVESIQIAAALNGKVDYFKTSAVIASDIKLNFYHIKPVLYALAEARISNYGFETSLPHATDLHAKASIE